MSWNKLDPSGGTERVFGCLPQVSHPTTRFCVYYNPAISEFLCAVEEAKLAGTLEEFFEERTVAAKRLDEACAKFSVENYTTDRFLACGGRGGNCSSQGRFPWWRAGFDKGTAPNCVGAFSRSTFLTESVSLGSSRNFVNLGGKTNSIG